MCGVMQNIVRMQRHNWTNIINVVLLCVAIFRNAAPILNQDWGFVECVRGCEIHKNSAPWLHFSVNQP